MILVGGSFEDISILHFGLDGSVCKSVHVVMDTSVRHYSQCVFLDLETIMYALS